VDHPLPHADALIRPWRTATLVATTIAALELALLIVVGGALLAKPEDVRTKRTTAMKAAESRAAHTPVARKAPAIGAPKLARSRVSVLVLNGNGRTGAAASVARRVHARGYRIGGVANAPRPDYTRSLVMYRAGFAAEGHRLARDLGVRIVGPLDGLSPADLGGAHTVLVVGA